MPFPTRSGTPSAGLPRSALRRAVVLVVALVALVNCRGAETPDARTSEDLEEPAANASAAGRTGAVVQNQLGDGRVQASTKFTFDSCGICPRDPNMDDWGSDFSRGFLGEGESCTYAPSRLVDGDPQTGWAEGAAGVGIGAEVAVPALLDTVRYSALDDEDDWHWAQIDPLDLSRPVRIWAGYGQSPELFAANGRPKRVRVTVLRLRLTDPDPHDMTGCSFATYEDPVAVAEHEVTLRDSIGFQPLPVPEFEVEHYWEYPMEWLRMDDSERQAHRQEVDAGRAASYSLEPWEYAYVLKLTLLDVYPGARSEDTMISEIGNVPQAEATPTLSADEAELWEGNWNEQSWIPYEAPLRFTLDIYGRDRLGFKYQSTYQDVPYGPNWISSAILSAQFDGPQRAVDPVTGHVFLLTVDPADRGARVIDVIEGDPGSLGWSPAEHLGPETLEGRWIFNRSVFRTGFDCDATITAIETTICRDEMLAQGDLEMNALYGELMRSVTPDQEQALRASQRGFLTSRDSDCQNDDDVDKRCLARHYADRLVALQRLQDPSLGDGSRFDAEYAKSILANGVDLRDNTAARMAMYPLQMETETVEWQGDESGLLFEGSYVGTLGVGAVDVEIRYSDMFFVGVGGGVVSAAHMAPADSVSYREYGFDPLAIQRHAGRDFLTIWREAEEFEPSLVRDWLGRHPIPDMVPWD